MINLYELVQWINSPLFKLFHWLVCIFDVLNRNNWCCELKSCFGLVFINQKTSKGFCKLLCKFHVKLILLTFIFSERWLDHDQWKKTRSCIRIWLVYNQTMLTTTWLSDCPLLLCSFICFFVPIPFIVEYLLYIANNLPSLSRVSNSFLELTVHYAPIDHPIARFVCWKREFLWFQDFDVSIKDQALKDLAHFIKNCHRSSKVLQLLKLSFTLCHLQVLFLNLHLL